MEKSIGGIVVRIGRHPLPSPLLLVTSFYPSVFPFYPSCFFVTTSINNIKIVINNSRNNTTQFSICRQLQMQPAKYTEPTSQFPLVFDEAHQYYTRVLLNKEIYDKQRNTSDFEYEKEIQENKMNLIVFYWNKMNLIFFLTKDEFNIYLHRIQLYIYI